MIRTTHNPGLVGDSASEKPFDPSVPQPFGLEVVVGGFRPYAQSVTPGSPKGRTGRPRNSRGRFVVGILLVWCVAVLGGIGYIMAYSNAPGEIRPTPAQWPASSKIQRRTERATLLMFVHPRCPCTRASLGELSRIVARHPSDLDVHVIAIRPEGLPSGWEQGDLIDDAHAIPGAIVDIDAHGTEARRFNSATSGHTLLYDERGVLRFSGGITAARGHAGDNAGEEAILGWLEKAGGAASATPVFGCELFSPDACSHGGNPTCHN